jgi:hypothetical protein
MSKNNSAEILLEWKKGIDQAKSQLAELTGKESVLKEQLKKDFGCDSIEDAITRVEELDKEIEQLKKKLEKGIDELQDEFDEINSSK